MALPSIDRNISDLGRLSLPAATRAVTVSDLRGMAQSSLKYLNHLLHDANGISGLNCKGTQARFEKALDQKWIQISENAIRLNPIFDLPAVLMHRGRDTPLSRDAMRRHDVFGNPAHNFPTYLSTTEMKCEADAWDSWDSTLTSEQKLLIEIESIKLLESRAVYIDPESLQFATGLGGGRDETGEMFMVLGGIPRSSMRTLKRPWVTNKNLCADWPDTL